MNEAFVRLHKKGLIYKSSYLVNWSPNLQTAVSDLEVRHSQAFLASPLVLILNVGTSLVTWCAKYPKESVKFKSSSLSVPHADSCCHSFWCVLRMHQILYRSQKHQLFNKSYYSWSVCWHQVEYETEAGKLYTFKYPLADSSDFLPVATTRPETILGDTAVAVNPDDERFKHMIGKECEVPFTNGRCTLNSLWFWETVMQHTINSTMNCHTCDN